MDSTRTCKLCGTPLVRKPAEAPGRFSRREFCDRRCSSAYREQQRDRPELGACEHCGQPFYNGLHGHSHYYWVSRRFCSTACANAQPATRWRILDNGCWEWTATPPYADGYARVRMDGRRIVAHRLVYQELRRTLAASEVLHHTCRNKLCVNPDHLEVISASAHMSLHLREDGRLVTLPPKICEWCGESYAPKGRRRYSVTTWAKQRFCSYSCATTARHRGL